MELIIHPTVKQKKEISYNHIIKLKDNLNIYIGNEASREAEHFDYIIEICNENELYHPLSYKPNDILTFMFNDSRTYNILKHKDEIIEFINKCEGKLLIHCGEGVSRSPSVFILYLIHNLNYTYEEAFKLISSKRFIKPNIGFIRQLKRI